MDYCDNNKHFLRHQKSILLRPALRDYGGQGALAHAKATAGKHSIPLKVKHKVHVNSYGTELKSIVAVKNWPKMS